MTPHWDMASLAAGLLLGGGAGLAIGALLAGRRRAADRALSLAQEQACLQAAIEPVLREFGELERLVGTARAEDAAGKAALRTQLTDDLRRVSDLVLRVDADARSIQSSLRGNVNLRGQWGEAVLEQILRNTGLVPGIHYERQPSLRAAPGEGGDLRRPDFVVRLPDGSAVVIDSKGLFPDCARAASAETAEARQEALRAHLQAFRNTLRDLASRHYERCVEGSIDFVLMFLPVEAALRCALDEDPALLTQAMERHVMPVGPSGLVMMLTLIHRIWRRDEERRNAARILDAARQLAERAMAFERDLDSVGAALAKAQSAFDAAVRRLQSTDPKTQSVARSLQTLRRLQGDSTGE